MLFGADVGFPSCHFAVLIIDSQTEMALVVFMKVLLSPFSQTLFVSIIMYEAGPYIS